MTHARAARMIRTLALCLLLSWPTAGTAAWPMAEWKVGLGWTIAVAPKVWSRDGKRGRWTLGATRLYQARITRTLDADGLRLWWVALQPAHTGPDRAWVGLVFVSPLAGPRMLALAKEAVRLQLRGTVTEVRRDHFRTAAKPCPALSDQEDLPLDFPVLTDGAPPARPVSSKHRITHTVGGLHFSRDVVQTTSSAPSGGLAIELSRPSDRRRVSFVFDPARPWPVHVDAPRYQAWLP